MSFLWWTPLSSPFCCCWSVVIHSHQGEVRGLDEFQASCLLRRCSPSRLTMVLVNRLFYTYSIKQVVDVRNPQYACIKWNSTEPTCARPVQRQICDWVNRFKVKWSYETSAEWNEWRSKGLSPKIHQKSVAPIHCVGYCLYWGVVVLQSL